ncbi:MAG: hypothetical protein FJZ01_02685 [Candidatus Sericytochromatia bacterium]|nr:hypothetical protein [Candidatus Tanganyikabacteria bacterium]
MNNPILAQVAAPALAAGVLAGCNLLAMPGSGGPNAAPTRTPDAFQVDVCADLAASNVPATAAAATSSAPALDTRHKRNRITLPASGSARAGYVKLNSDKAGDWQILLTRDVPLKVGDAGGTWVPPAASRSAFPDCPDIAAQYTVNLKLGTYYLYLGPTSETEVSIVTENGEEE